MEPQKRISLLLDQVTQDLESGYIRKMQSKMHHCAADCCDDLSVKSRDLQRCIESCSTSLNNTEQYITREFNILQNRLQRCVQDCNDEVRSKLGPNPTEAEIRQGTSNFEKCAERCVDKMEMDVPLFVKNIKTFIETNK